jgi:hypothetical protein
MAIKAAVDRIDRKGALLVTLKCRVKPACAYQPQQLTPRVAVQEGMRNICIRTATKQVAKGRRDEPCHRGVGMPANAAVELSKQPGGIKSPRNSPHIGISSGMGEQKQRG